VLLAALGLFGSSGAGCAGSSPPPPPPPGLDLYSDEDDRSAYGTLVRDLLDARQFARLDGLADSLQQAGARFDNGATRLAAFYHWGMRTVADEKDPEQWKRHLLRLREWRGARPQSVHAPVALAYALIGRGWAARGGDSAPAVTERGWRGFSGDLEEAGAILERCAATSKSTPPWYVAKLEVINGLNGDSPSYDAVYQEGIARFPAYNPFYLERAWHLMPRWFGKPGDLEAAAAECAPTLPDSLRDEIYARIVTAQIHYEDDVFKAYPRLDWDRTRRGLEIWRRHFPISPEPTAALARFAFQTGHHDVARSAFQSLGDTVHVEVWSPQDYARTREALAASSQN
jgi:hypothetical protein